MRDGVDECGVVRVCVCSLCEARGRTVQSSQVAGVWWGQMRGLNWSSNTSVIHSFKCDICTIVILCVHSVVSLLL